MWSRGQLLLRGLVPVALLLAVAPVSRSPLLLVVVALGGAAAALQPESGAGTVALGLVVVAWALGGGPLWAALPAAALLLVAHVALLVAASGPRPMPVDPALLRLWAGRGLVVLPAAGAALLATLLPAYSWLWTGALLLAAVVGWLGVVALSRLRE